MTDSVMRYIAEQRSQHQINNQYGEIAAQHTKPTIKEPAMG